MKIGGWNSYKDQFRWENKFGPNFFCPMNVSILTSQFVPLFEYSSDALYVYIDIELPGCHGLGDHQLLTQHQQFV